MKQGVGVQISMSKTNSKNLLPDLDEIDSSLNYGDDEIAEYGNEIDKLTSDIEIPADDEIDGLGLSDENDESEPTFGVKSDDPDDAEEEKRNICPSWI